MLNVVNRLNIMRIKKWRLELVIWKLFVILLKAFWLSSIDKCLIGVSLRECYKKERNGVRSEC